MLRSCKSILILIILITSSCTILKPTEQTAPTHTLTVEIEMPTEITEKISPTEVPTPIPPTPTPKPSLITSENAVRLHQIGQVELSSPYHLTWSTDSTMVGAITLDGLSLLDVSKMAEETSVVLKSPINLLDFSPSTRIMATTSDMLKLDLRDMSSGELLRTIDPQGPFFSTVFSYDGKTLALPLLDEIAVTLWDVESGQQLNTLKGFETAAPVYSVSFSPDANYLIWISRAHVQVMDIASGQLGPYFMHEDFVGDVALSPDGHVLAVTTAEFRDEDYVPLVKLWDIVSGQSLGDLMAGTMVTSSLDFSPDGRLIATGTDGRLIIWEIAGQKPLIELSGHSERISSVAFSPDGVTLTTAGYDGTVRFWRVTP